MEQNPKPIVKVFLFHGKMHCYIVENDKDITSSVSKVVLTLENGKVVSSNVEKHGGK
jgi:hypothetical protein